MNNTYAQAYTEVLEILKLLPKYQYNKIPKKEIKFYEENRDVNYDFKIDKTKPIENQQISRKASAIICTIFRDFFATESQKEKMKKILQINEQIKEKEAKQKYNPNELFKSKTYTDNKSIENQEVSLIKPEKISLFKRIMLKIIRAFKLT